MKITDKFEKVFGIPFDKLIENNFQKGASRYFIQKTLMEMIVDQNLIDIAVKTFPHSKGFWNKNNWTYDRFGAVSKESNPAFRPSAIYHAIKNERIKKEIEFQFDFCVTNKGRKPGGEPREDLSTKIELVCQNCGKRHTNNEMVFGETLNLRVYECPNPNCGVFGKCFAKIIRFGKTFYKGVVKVGNIRKESYIQSFENPTPIDCPPGSTKNSPTTIKVDEEKVPQN